MKYDYLLKWKFDWIAGNRHLTSAESENNAKIVAQMLIDMDMSMNACAAVLGNMQGESGINPDIWENLGNAPDDWEYWIDCDENGENCTYNPYYREDHGYGLVQWTPATKFINWAEGLNWNKNFNYEPYRLYWEMENGQQWIPTTAYPISFRDFWKSNNPIPWLTYAFMSNYERPASLDHPDRIQYAEHYLDSVVKRTLKTSLRNLLFAQRKKRKFVWD